MSYRNCTIQDLVDEGLLHKPIDGNHGNIHPKSADFVDEGIPFVMASDLQNGVVNLKKASKISVMQASSLQKGFSYSGDILLSHKGSIGLVAKVPELDTDYIMLTPQVTYYRVKNDQELDADYIKYYFLSDIFQWTMKNLSGGGTRSYIGISAQRKLPFILPELETQKMIVSVLNSWDDYLEKLDQKIEAKKNIKKGLMQQLLTGKSRLPGYKSEWTETHLSAIAKVDSGFGFSEKFQGHSDKEIPFIKVSDMNLSGNETKITVWNNSVTADEMNQMKARTFPLGSIVFPKIGAAINTNKKRLLTRPTIVDNNVMVLIPIETVSANFLFQWMLAFDLKRWANDSGVPSMRKSEVEAHLLKIPSDFDEMREIGEILNVADDEIEALSLLKRCVLDQKKYLLNNLVTGKISTSKSTEVKEAVHA